MIELPPELLLHVILYLPSKYVGILHRVGTHFVRLYQTFDEIIWKPFVENEISKEPINSKQNSFRSYKHWYYFCRWEKLIPLKQKMFDKQLREQLTEKLNFCNRNSVEIPSNVFQTLRKMNVWKKVFQNEYHFDREVLFSTILDQLSSNSIPLEPIDVEPIFLSNNITLIKQLFSHPFHQKHLSPFHLFSQKMYYCYPLEKTTFRSESHNASHAVCFAQKTFLEATVQCKNESIAIFLLSIVSKVKFFPEPFPNLIKTYFDYGNTSPLLLDKIVKFFKQQKQISMNLVVEGLLHGLQLSEYSTTVAIRENFSTHSFVLEKLFLQCICLGRKTCISFLCDLIEPIDNFLSILYNALEIGITHQQIVMVELLLTKRNYLQLLDTSMRCNLFLKTLHCCSNAEELSLIELLYDSNSMEYLLPQVIDHSVATNQFALFAHFFCNFSLAQLEFIFIQQHQLQSIFSILQTNQFEWIQFILKHCYGKWLLQQYNVQGLNALLFCITKKNTIMSAFLSEQGFHLKNWKFDPKLFDSLEWEESMLIELLNYGCALDSSFLHFAIGNDCLALLRHVQLESHLRFSLEDCLCMSHNCSLSMIQFLWENLNDYQERIDMGSMAHILSYMGRIDGLIYLLQTTQCKHLIFFQTILETNCLEQKHCISILKDQNSIPYLLHMEYDYERIAKQRIPKELIIFISELALKQFYIATDAQLKLIRAIAEETLHLEIEGITPLGFSIQQSLYDCCFYLLCQRSVNPNQYCKTIYQTNHMEHPLTLTLLYCSQHYKEKLIELLLLKGAKIDVILLCKLLQICLEKKLYSIGWRLLHKSKSIINELAVKEILCSKQIAVPLEWFSMSCCYLNLQFSKEEVAQFEDALQWYARQAVEFNLKELQEYFEKKLDMDLSPIRILVNMSRC